jgi:ribonuclease HI
VAAGLKARRAGAAKSDKPEVVIYTDGACSGNPGPGGWAAVLRYGDHEREISGGEGHTTNQRMELRAAVEGLRALTRPCRVRLHSDSAYLVNCFRQRWSDNWIKNGWMTRAKTPVGNRDLWEELIRLNETHDVEWIKVAGHSGDPLNERCDLLARQAAERAAVEVGPTGPKKPRPTGAIEVGPTGPKKPRPTGAIEVGPTGPKKPRPTGAR